MLPVRDLSGFVVPTWLFVGVLGVAVLLAIILAAGVVYRRRQRAYDDVVRTTAIRFDASAWHPDRRTDLEKQHDDLKGRFEDLERNYDVLLARHKALIREFERREQDRPPPRRPSPAMRPGARA